jgi:hypothetical protein
MINAQIKLNEEGAFNLKGSLGYLKGKYELLNSNTHNQVVLVPNDVHYDISVLKPAVQLKYKTKVSKITAYMSLGLFTPIFLSDKGTIHSKYDQTASFSSVGYDSKGSLDGMLGETGEIGIEIGNNPGSFILSLFNDYYFTNPFSGSYNLGLKCGYCFK